MNVYMGKRAHAMKVIYGIPSTIDFLISFMKCWQAIVVSTMCDKVWRASQSQRSLFDIPHLLWDLHLCSDLALCEIYLVFTIVSGRGETWLSDGGVMHGQEDH